MNEFSEKSICIKYKYAKINSKHPYEDEIIIDFGEYREFLEYISDVDELNKSIKKLIEPIEKISTLGDKIEKHLNK